MLKKTYILIILVLFLTALAFLLAPSLLPEATPSAPAPPAAGEAPQLPTLPEQFAGLQLVSSESGEVAMQEILKLHRNPFPLLDGLIAKYSGAAEVTVRVSLSPTIDEANMLMERMVETMPASTVFKEESVFPMEGQQIYHVTGMGMDHYYWLDGLYVYWLAVEKTTEPLAVLAAFIQAL
ncbi:MAG: hypothetical protein DDT19_01182 [Syntrophomonadaceae bacterium]|nr:hypothetical protein [Bacillota bacterium]